MIARLASWTEDRSRTVPLGASHLIIVSPTFVRRTSSPSLKSIRHKALRRTRSPSYGPGGLIRDQGPCCRCTCLIQHRSRLFRSSITDDLKPILDLQDFFDFPHRLLRDLLRVVRGDTASEDQQAFHEFHSEAPATCRETLFQQPDRFDLGLHASCDGTFLRRTLPSQDASTSKVPALITASSSMQNSAMMAARIVGSMFRSMATTPRTA